MRRAASAGRGAADKGPRMNRCILVSAAILASTAGCNIPRLAIFAGTATESVAGELRADSSLGVTGDTVGLETDLGVSDKSSPVDARLMFAMGRGMLDVSYSQRSISSVGSFPGITDFADVPLDTIVATKIDLEEFRVAVGRRAISGSKKYIFSVRAGAFAADWSASLRDSIAQTATAGQFTVVPVVGAGLDIKMGPLASLFVEAEGMGMDAFDTKASLFGWGAGVRVSFIQAQLMLGYRSRSLDIEEDGERLALDTDGGTFALQLQLSLNM